MMAGESLTRDLQTCAHRVVAGAGLGEATATLCADVECTHAIKGSSTSAWEQSLKIVLPEKLPAPTFLRIAGKDGQPKLVPLNAPDIWWVASGSPGTLPNSTARRSVASVAYQRYCR